MLRRAATTLALLALLGGCGGEDEPDAVVVSAAASLKTAFTAYAERFEAGTVRASFAGSDELAAQIRQGVKPDVFAAANTKLPQALFDEGLVEAPVVFATNELVVAVPADGSEVTGLDDLAQDGVALAIGAEDVPVGDYARTVLDRLPGDTGDAVLANVRSEEPDVAGIVGKLTQGAVDAGFVYRSDVTAAGGRLRAIELPDALKPTVEYGVALVKGGENPEGGRAFIEGLRAGAGRQALTGAGLGAP